MTFDTIVRSVLFLKKICEWRWYKRVYFSDFEEVRRTSSYVVFYVLSELKKLTIRHLCSMEITYVDQHIHVNFLEFLDEDVAFVIPFWIVLMSSRLKS